MDGDHGAADQEAVADFLVQISQKLTPAVVEEALKSNGHFELHFAEGKYQRIQLFRKDAL